ncbi:FAD-dependent oxidoreductase [Longispora albida]|uniref:FAD-dependent oxidoreductase n=1 Tax=Longispora albida TaxID=203523 RepID=UPI0012F813A0
MPIPAHLGRFLRSFDVAYIPLLQRSYELWRQAERKAGVELLTINGGLTLGTSQSGTFLGSVRSAEEWGLEHQILEVAETNRRFPTLTPGKDLLAVHDPNAGVLRPEVAVAAHLKLAGGWFSCCEVEAGCRPPACVSTCPALGALLSVRELAGAAGSWALIWRQVGDGGF